MNRQEQGDILVRTSYFTIGMCVTLLMLLWIPNIWMLYSILVALIIVTIINMVIYLDWKGTINILHIVDEE